MERKPGAIIAVSGNIGAGKSTLVRAAVSPQYREHFLRLLDPHPAIPRKAEAYEEQFDRNLLGFTSKDPWYVLPFQVSMLVTSATLDGLIAQEGGIAFLDRTVYEHRYVFGEMQRTLERISDKNFEIYDRLFKEVTKVIPPPLAYIRLMASEESLRRRISVRGRKEEKGLLEADSTYLNSLDQAFDYFFKFHVSQPVIEVKTDDIVLAGDGGLDHDYFERTFPYIAKEIERLDILKDVK